MARGGVNFGASFEKFKKQVLPINIETRSEVDANTILKYADLQNVPATLKSIGDLFVVILDKPLEIRDSMEGRIKELLKGKSYAKGGATTKKTYTIEMNPFFTGVDKYTVKSDKGSVTFTATEMSLLREYVKDLKKQGYQYDNTDYARGGETNKFEIYHDTLSSALEEVEDYAKKNGYDIIGDYFPDVKVGGINYGETKRFSLPVNKQGKKNDGKIMIQIYRMDSGRYELNMYPTYAKGGATFDDKVKAISSSLTGKEVPKRLRKDYGKKYNKKEALEAARRIAGSMRAKEIKKGKK